MRLLGYIYKIFGPHAVFLAGCIGVFALFIGVNRRIVEATGASAAFSGVTWILLLLFYMTGHLLFLKYAYVPFLERNYGRPQIPLRLGALFYLAGLGVSFAWWLFGRIHDEYWGYLVFGLMGMIFFGALASVYAVYIRIYFAKKTKIR